MIYEGDCRLGDLFSNRREKGRAGLPTLSVTLNDGLVSRGDLDRKQDTTLSPEEHLLVKPGDIAYNMMRMWQGAFGLSNTEGLVSPAYVVLKPKPDVDSQYVAYLFKTNRVRYLFWAFSYGLTEDRLRLYFDDFRRIPAFVHKLSDQTKIAELLKTWDAAIQLTGKLLSLAREAKQSLMQQLLSPKHPADWRRNRWRRVPFSEIASIDAETLPSKTPPDFEFSYISLADVDSGAISKNLARHQFQTAPSRARRLLKNRDILMSTVRPNLKGYARVNEENAKHIASTGFAVLSCLEEVNPDYLYHYLYTEDIQRQLYALVAGSSYPAINSGDVEDLLINIPDLETQGRLANFLEAQDREITGLARQQELLVAEQSALMQRLYRFSQTQGWEFR